MPGQPMTLLPVRGVAGMPRINIMVIDTGLLELTH